MPLKKTKKRLFRLTLIALVAGGLFVFLKHQKEAIIRECTALFQSAVSQKTDMTVRIGKISGRFLGTVRFQDVVVADPARPNDPAFRCDEIDVRYNFLDFISKNPNPKIAIDLKKPRVHWRPGVRLRRPKVPMLVWLRNLALSQRRYLVIRAESLDLSIGDFHAEGMDFTFENNAFRFQVPLRHVTLVAADVTSVVSVDGGFELGENLRGDVVGGHIRTEGTVINWKPLSHETSFDFVLSHDQFRLISNDFLGGITVNAQADFTRDDDIDLAISATDYPLSNFDAFFGASPGLPGSSSFDLRLEGSPVAPSIEGRFLWYDGIMSKRAFKIMELNFDGVYPTLRIGDSHVLLTDGTSMRFADTTLEVGDLFKEKTYHSLIESAQQDTVVWGDWRLSRRKNETNEQSDLLMQRELGGNALVNFKRTNDERPMPDAPGMNPDRDKQLEVGLEYRLKAKDSLKLSLRDTGEEFVGVERKLKF